MLFSIVDINYHFYLFMANYTKTHQVFQYGILTKPRDKFLLESH